MPNQLIEHRRAYTALLLVAILTVMTTLVVERIPHSVVSTASSAITGACGLVVLLCAYQSFARGRSLNLRVLIFRLTLLIWWYVLVSEQLFDRFSDPVGAEAIHTYEAQFAPEAYGESLIWILSFILLLIILLRKPQYVRHMFSGSIRWASLFAVLCLFSVVYSPAKMYSLGWSFKLILLVLMLKVLASTMKSLNDIVTFFGTTLLAFLVLTVLPVIVAFSNPETAFSSEGRLSGNPPLLSECAGSLLLMALMLYSIQRKKFFAIVGLVGGVVMFLSLGKAGIIAGVLSATLMLVLQRKVGSSLGLVIGMTALAAVLFVFVGPLARYLQTYEGLDTITGRTDIWSKAMPDIAEKPILGHGYLSSRYVWLTEQNRAAKAGHMHNGFLEVAYNNGAIGLLLIVVMHAVVVRNLFYSLRNLVSLRRRLWSEQIGTAYPLVCGSIALYVNILINGLFSATFGGKAISPFVLFLSLLVITDKLLAWTNQSARAGDLAGTA